MKNINPGKNAVGAPAKTLMDKVFSLIITVLAIVFVILICSFVGKFRSYSRLLYIDEPNIILNQLNRSAYDDAVNATWRNRALDVKDKDSSYVIPYALSDYYMAAFYETAYRAAGNTPKADELAAKKAGYREKAGDLVMIADEIDSVLERFR